MSRRNREKRAAKQKARRRSAAGPPPDRGQTQDGLTAALWQAARCPCDDVDVHVAQILVEYGAQPGREIDAAAELAVLRMVTGAWNAGWMPLDVVELARRRLAPSVVEYLCGAVVVESRRYAPAMVHPRWRDAVAEISASLGPPPPDGVRHLTWWAEREELDRHAALVAVLSALGLLCALPVLERLLPLPGESRHGVEPEAGEVDQKALSKVRGLLAKAESTEFPDEAEALSAKAQELMSRYSLHQAVVDHDRGRAPVASGRRLWLDAPYADAKALLVQEVAAANRARTVWTGHLGFATVVGDDTDLDAVELLVTSLLVQASRAMLAAGSQRTRSGTSRTRSFRQSFLISYATRVGERLADAASTATTQVGAELREDGRLLPVLAARSRVADEMTERLFPTMVQKGVSVSNHAGWAAGRAAADQAQFEVRRSVAG